MRPIDGDALRDKLQNLGYDDWNQGVTTTWAEAFYACADIVADAPTIEPERKTEKWIKPKEHDHLLQCSECEYEVTIDMAYEYNYCPLCGADMRTAKQIAHDAIDNTPMAEDVFVGIKDQLHKAVDEFNREEEV